MEDRKGSFHESAYTRGSLACSRGSFAKPQGAQGATCVSANNAQSVRGCLFGPDRMTVQGLKRAY
jgi:hypothetical protein